MSTDSKGTTTANHEADQAVSDLSGSSHLLKLGTVNYAEALALQDRLVKARYEGKVGDLLILLEHPHTYT
ncbi:MAG: hypothetical protein M1358_08305, partial [Chloroflexi bacterium]|nr:hypothetical protein [Chloroflexota bacterium]